MVARFQTPPGWPAPPAGWAPPPGWQPPPEWPPAPEGWAFWTDEPAPRRGSPTRGVILGGLCAVVVGIATSGLSTALLITGAVALVLGLLGALLSLRRRAPDGRLDRRRSAIVAAVGVVALATGGATAPGSAPKATPAAASSTVSATATPSVDPSAAAEQAAVEADRLTALEETEESAPSTPTTAEGLLDGDVAATRITAAPRASALAALAAVQVKGRAPKAGYARAQFGSGWVDTDRNGCDTRNDVLARDLTAETFKPGTRDCVVLTGTLADPYSGSTIAFQRGQGTSEAVQIDHVVALSDAWQKGAQGWDAEKRTAFANDGLNLLAVDGPLNASKGDGDAATWLPPARAYRCAYVARQVAVKVRYGLWMTQAEKDASATVLSRCPDEPLPGGVVAPVPARATATTSATPAPASTPKATAAAPRSTPRATVPPAAPAAPRSTAAPAAPAPEAPAGGGSVSYANCDAVRAAGAAPIHPGDPGWQSKFDRDKDGVGCDT